ncbi:MAG TPA: hypothetical protein VH482_12030 [Thermomicrobiales bacterium]|jgi:hypothetical protein
MKDAVVGGYRRARRGVVVAGMAVALLGVAAGGALASGGTYGKADKVGGGDHEFHYSTYAITVGDYVYQYANGKDGWAYYTYYDGNAWSDWISWPDQQPAKVKYDPAPVEYHDNNYVFYTGEDGHIYHLWGEAGVEPWNWEDLSGDFAFKYAPYANENGDYLYLYGVSKEGYVYSKQYDGSQWSDWANVSGETYSAYEPYSVEYGGYENVFWTSDDGKVYWNRYDGKKWTGVKELPYADYEYEFKYAPYAVEYAPEKSLYAYAVSKDGEPSWNVFDGKKWTGWKPYKGLDAKVKYQPNAYVYDDVQHLVFTGADGHAYYTEYAGKWSDDWQDLGANYNYDPYQYSYGDKVYLTYTGKDSYAYYKPYEAGSDDDSGY